MPQFDPAVWSTQLIWLAITFTVLYLLMARVLVPRISEVLEEREFRISDSLRKAENLRRVAEDAIAAYEQTMADARSKAQEQVRIAREAAAQQAAERHGELTQRLNAEISAAETRIAKARDEAVAALRDVAADIAGLAVQQLVGEKMDAKVVASTVDAVMAETR